MKEFKISKDITEKLSEEEMINKYKPLVKNKANYWYNYYCKIAYEHVSKLDLEDFEQQGYLTIIKTYRAYNIKFDTLYYTFLLTHMDNYMKILIRDTLKLRRDKYSLLDKKLLSIDKQYSTKEDAKNLTLAESISYEQDDFEDIINKIVVNDLLTNLNSYQKNLIEDYYYKELNQSELAIKYNTSQASISRELVRIKNKLREKEQKSETRKEPTNMAKLNEEKLKIYLLSNANKEITVSKLITNYCKKECIPSSTVFTALTQRMPLFYKEIKKMCKQNDGDGLKRISIDTENLKNFIIEKVEIEKQSLNKALTLYSSISKISISSLRNHLTKEEPDFMERIKSISISNLPENQKTIALKTFDKHNTTSQSINTQVQTEIKEKHISTKESDDFKELIKDMKLSFSSNNFTYAINDNKVYIYNSEGHIISNPLTLDDIESFIKELEKVVKVGKVLF